MLCGLGRVINSLSLVQESLKKRSIEKKESARAISSIRHFQVSSIATGFCEMSWPNGTSPPPETPVFSNIIGTHLPHEQEISGITEQHINFEATLHQDNGMVNNQEVEKSLPHTKKRKLRSMVWKEFTKTEEGKKEWAVCNHCKKKFPGSSKSGTTHLKNHLSSCRSKLRNPGGDAADKSADKTGDRLTTTWVMKGKRKIDEGLNQLDDTRMIIKYWRPSLVSVKDNILNVFKEEKQKLMSFFHKLPCSLNVLIEHLDDDFMPVFCLSVHFIDDDWKLKTKVIHIDVEDGSFNFLEKLKCIIMDWNMDVSSIADDDVEFVAKEYELIRELRGSLPFAGTCLPVHWLLAQLCDFDFDIWGALEEVFRKMEILKKYLSSNSKFEKAVDKAAAASSMSVSIKHLADHSAQLKLLEWGVGLKEVFWELDDIDPIGFKPINLTKEEWDIATELYKFWKGLGDVEELRNGDCKYTSPSVYFHKIYRLYMIILQWQKSDMYILWQKASEERKYFDEFWSNSKLILAITLILDPRFKMEIVQDWYVNIYGNDSGIQIKEIIDEVVDIYSEYAKASESSKTSPMLDRGPCTSSTQSELDRYLKDSIYPFREGFDILDWWRCNSPVYPTLARMARDYLAIPLGGQTGMDSSLEDEIRNIFNSKGVDDDIKMALVHTKAWL